MLKMTGLSKAYRTEVVETFALREFDLEVKQGEFVAVTGPSGSGKTTFLTIAGLLEAPTAGRYELDGVDVSQLGDDARSRIRNQKIGFIFQGFNLIADLNVFDNVDVPLRYRGLQAKQRRELIEEALAVVGLTARLKHHPSQLSGGQQQRVAVARALVGRPGLILADEPTGNLDPKTSEVIWDLFLRLQAEHHLAFVIATHNHELARKADRGYRLVDGRAVPWP